MAPQRGGGPPPAQRLQSTSKTFKQSPFYEILETLVPFQDLPDGPEMPQNRHTVKSQFTVRPDLAQQIRNDSLRILMYCGQAHLMAPYSSVDVAFPNQIEVKVNDVDVKANFKGLKNKPGSTKPADITALVRKFSGQQNNIQITYALTQKRYIFVVYLLRYIPADRLVERIKKHSVIRKQKVLEAMSKANADPDIAATSIRMSLKDPISTMRITTPIRSSHCTHNQCFDAAMFMQLQEQAPQWSCPICTKSIPFETLCVDEYFQEILNSTPKDTEKIDVEPNGEWKAIKEEEDAQANGTSGKARASYDDDFEDDLVEVEQPDGKQVNGLKKESRSQSIMLSPAAARGAGAFDTPPLSSREPSVAQSASSAQRQGSNKRPQSVVIDLTLSDDEDEPPRPAKRQQMANRTSALNNSTSSYNTPTSIPDQRYQQPQSQQSYNHAGTGQADNYRPANQQPQNQQSYNHAASGQADNYRPQYNYSGADQADNYRQSINDYSQHNQAQPNSYTAYNAQPSLSPSNASPPAGFAQPNWPAQHSRSLPSHHQTFANGGYSSGPGGIYPPNSSFAIRPPSQHQQGSSSATNTQSPVQQHSSLRLPPVVPQQQQPSYSPQPQAQTFHGGWRSDSGEYGGYGFSQSPPG
ncbi:E3 SUMO-protein ligase pli1 [Vermiconidia calcicola]|uniref:E3 SUMO-protein ligase pli1 n=1 Tax=Vermiconidia calcicola TaxID=1690605 RepID=A0ACC3N5P7_9PEZI|nr:E3 SUMO-protein ligase pli1 [Vermiconidia calcicola]